MSRKFDRYIALGDSLSIDLYPGLDVVERGDPSYTGPPPGGLGAVSLFFRNDDARWPEFAGRDLASLAPGIAFRNEHQHTGPRTIEGDHFATDAATSTGVLAYQLARVPPSDERTLFTVTSGLFDVVQMMGAPNPPPTLVEGMLSRTERLLRTIAGKRPDSLVLLGTVVDPSDGTGELETLEPFARERNWIESYNLALREVIRPFPTARLVDVHGRLLGHGASADDGERWYWRGSLLKPGARAASELRRLWLEALEG
jgi:hypothetical protein